MRSDVGYFGVGSEIVEKLAALQSLGSSLRSPIELPQIVVLGSQSSGKSSVIESLVGISFLPRGTGIVTRVPLLLHLRDRGVQGDDYATFSHLPDKEFRDFDQVRDEIAARTDALAGASKGVEDLPITLSVHAHNAPALTLVDLPGVTKVPVRGQPEDIEQRIRSLCLKYAGNGRAILLCITPANADVANSDALRLAREVDRSGKRTIGVLTKLDLMDGGTDAMEVLRNEALPLRLGYVAVVCRGHLSSVGGSMQAQRDKETLFFDDASKPYARDLVVRRENCGVPTLARKLSELLVAATKEAAPALRTLATARLTAAERELGEMQTGVYEEDGEHKSRLLELVLEFASNYVSLIKGETTQSFEGTGRDMLINKHDDESDDDYYYEDDDELEDTSEENPASIKKKKRQSSDEDSRYFPRGAATIARTFEAVFERSLNGVDALDDVSDSDVRAAIRATSSLPMTLYVPERAFHALVRSQIARLEEPGLRCVELVHDELRRCADDLAATGRVSRAPALAAAVREVAHDVASQLLCPTRALVSELVACELAHINTRHPDFTRAIQTIQVPRCAAPPEDHPAPVKAAPTRSNNQEQPGPGWFGRREPPSKQQRRKRQSFVIAESRAAADDKTRAGRSVEEVRTVKSLIAAYFCVVRKTFCDLVPKIVMAKLVERVAAKLRAELVNRVFARADSEEAEALLQEPDDLRRQRLEAMREVGALKQALKLLDDIETGARIPTRLADHNVNSDDELDRRDTITIRKRTPSKGSPKPTTPAKEKENRRAMLTRR